MDFKAAIAALKKLDGGADLAAAIESHVTTLDGKIFEAKGESQAKSSKASSLESTVLAIAKSLCIEGEIETVMTALEPKVSAIASDLRNAQAKLTETETAKTAAEAKVSGFERKGKLTEIATKAGASAAVLETLFGDKLDQLSIDGDAVKFGDKALREHVEADAVLKDFLPSLFPVAAAEQPATKTAPRLPNSPPSGNNSNSKDPVGSYLKRAYTGRKAFEKPQAQ